MIRVLTDCRNSRAASKNIIVPMLGRLFIAIVIIGTAFMIAAYLVFSGFGVLT